MTLVNSILLFIGSLGELLYGMHLMSDGVQKSAGEKLQRALAKLTGNPFIGLITGLLITMIIQSSGATTVMVISFINAGLLTLTQSVGVIFGANIGTTITAWIVSLFGFNFKISTFALPIFGLGFFLTLIKDSRSKNIGEAIMGFGLLFLGLSGLSDVFTFDAENLTFLSKIQSWGIFSILIAVFVGIVITALMHSSSAFSAIVITMAFNGIITWETACAMTLGSNIGSTIDAILAGFGSCADARRSAIIHVMFNVFGTILALLFFKPFINFVSWLTPSNNIAIKLAMLHTVFKTLNTILLFPFTNQLVSITKILIKDDKIDALKTYNLEFIDTGFGKESTAMHIIRIEKEIADMSDVVSEMFDNLQIGFINRDDTFVKNNMVVLANQEEYCDQMHEKLEQYIVKCQQLSITESQRGSLSNMVQIVDELEAMSDQCYSTAILVERSIKKSMVFPMDDMEQLLPYIELARQFMQFIHININKHLEPEKQAFAQELEEQIDEYRKKLKRLARKRLEEGADVKSELLYLDLTRHIEKIGDHAFTISELLSQVR